MFVLKHRTFLSFLLLYLVLLALCYRLPSSVKLPIAITSASVCFVLLFIGRILRSFWRAAVYIALTVAVLAVSVLPSYLYDLTDRELSRRAGDTVYASVLIDEITYESEGFCYANGTLLSCNGEEENIRVCFSLSVSAPQIGEVYSGIAALSAMDSKDTLDAYSLSRGYRYSLEFEHAQRTGSKLTCSVISAKLRTFLCNTIRNHTKGQSASLLCAMLLGEKDGLSDTFNRDMQRLGLSHMLALSGMHFTILLLGIERLFSLLSIDKRLRYLLIAFLTLLYLFIIGSSPSALRAGIMMLVLILSFFLGKEYDALTSLAFSVALICTVFPYTVCNTSLMLSAFATCGILLALGNDYGERSDRKQYKNLILRLLAKTALSIKITLAASFATLPFLAFQFGTFPLLLVVTNLLFAPLMQFLLYAAVLVLLFGFLPPIAVAATFLSESIIKLASFFAGIPHIQISILRPDLLIILLSGTLLFGVLYLFPPRKEKRAKISAVILAAICLFASLSGTVRLLYHSGTLTIHHQTTEKQTGEFFILSENGCTSVIDSTFGTEKDMELLFERLEEEHLVEIDYYVITSYQASHMGTLREVMANNTVHHLILPIPTSALEEEIFASLLVSAKIGGGDIALYLEEKPFMLGNTELCLHDTSLSEGKGNSLFFSVKKNGSRFAYLSAEMLHIGNWEKLSESLFSYDVIFFGTYGSDYRNNRLPPAHTFSKADIYAAAQEHIPFENGSDISYHTRHTFFLDRSGRFHLK